MNDTITAAPNRKFALDVAVSVGITAAVLFFIGSGVISYMNIAVLQRNTTAVTHTHEVIIGLEDLLSLMKDAETGQRGFILTGNERYLEPYNEARARLDQRLGDIERLTVDNAIQQSHVTSVRKHIQSKMDELEESIQLRRSKGFDAARDLIISDRGRSVMIAIRNDVSAMQAEERNLRAKRFVEMEDASRRTMIGVFITAGLGLVLSLAVAFLMYRSASARLRQQWLQAGQVGLANAMLGDQRVDQLGDNILKFLAQYLNIQAGAFFVQDGSAYRRMATYGVPANSDTPTGFTTSDGLLGQAVKDNRSFILNDVPEGYLSMGSALGTSKPNHLIIFPADVDGVVNAVIELGSIRKLDEIALALLEQASEVINVAVRSANYRANLQNLLEETQRQAEELQAQSEELRVSNEELEEQSRALKESQSRLEQQQAELEQTNAQLEEQTQMLEVQKDDLNRTKEAVEQKAQELEQASQYKSDFLANMSHELRTPLNSSLIMAKLLADNPGGHLSDEQVKYAETIQSSGNDLLALINDILDLSKIEAGYMEIRPETVPLSRLLDDQMRNFKAVAELKGLELITQLGEGVAETIETDRQRLEQILKNLISNAIKFTEKGSVTLRITKGEDGQIIFAVKDTGIGIAKDQQQAIFDAFRQADGTISRKYGGTGLGLSISRELTRLLGGSIQLDSEVGEGSTFAVTLPDSYNATFVAPRTQINFATKVQDKELEVPELHTISSLKSKKRWIEDDREKLTSTSRVILIVEDDESFARIFYDLVHELGFQCLISTTADDALVVAKQYLPSAVVLDIGLPDHSGLSVLDRLKRDGRTRHIPVHVVSANDHSEKAFSLGAVGYMLKPVKRDELADAIKKLEHKLDQRMRRVLIVEDDQVQQDSVRKLLGSRDVETVGVGTVAECLEKLKGTTFDCMVLDLTLPDASGYSLLETLSQEDSYSFPPVIVYTGHDLSNDEEQKLRRYSKSIIIKGAKSPERLLDEVTLFLHQVESDLPPEQQRMLEKARNRDAMLEGRNILVVEDDIRNVYSLTSILEPHGAVVQIARNGVEALDILNKAANDIDLILMDVMMPEMDGLTATREIRKNKDWKKLPVIMLTAKAMKDDQERCLEAGANDYMAKPLDVEKLLSLVRVWMPR